MSADGMVCRSLLAIIILMVFVSQVLACDCGMNTIPHIPGETSSQFFLRQTQAQYPFYEVIVEGRFISVKGLVGLFKSSKPSGRFEVMKVIKGNVGRFITVYTDINTDCSTPWILEQSLNRRDHMVMSVLPHKDAAGITYELNLCDISYYPADLEKPTPNAGAKNP